MATDSRIRLRLNINLRAERMTRRRHVIEAALDFARMPLLARTSVLPPVPDGILEIMRIAAASPKACRDAAKVTGEPTPALIEAARFYLQQLLFRPDADCHRVLGLQPGASRATARSHMRWLLQWLHPDHNSDLEAVYAERVVKAWREVSTLEGPDGRHNHIPNASNGAETRGSQFRLPWIKYPPKVSSARGRSGYLAAVVWAIPGLVFALIVLWSAVGFFGIGPTAAILSLP